MRTTWKFVRLALVASIWGGAAWWVAQRVQERRPRPSSAGTPAGPVAPTVATPARVPTDTALIDVTTDLDASRGDAQFGALEGGSVRCFTCHQSFDADTVDASSLTRLEGASDPADMVAVVPVVCPNCSASGSMVLHFGAQASAEEADVLVALDRRPSV